MNIFFILLSLFLSSFQFLFSQTMKKTNTIEDFYMNVASKQKLILKNINYQVGSVIVDDSLPFVINEKNLELRFNKEADAEISGYTLVFKNLETFQLLGRLIGEDSLTWISSASENGDMIVFENCKNLLLRNIRFGFSSHSEKNAAVIRFINCENITIDNCYFVGNSNNTLLIENVNNGVFTKTTFSNTRCDLMVLNNLKNGRFEECVFKNSPKNIVISNDKEHINVDPIVFSKCSFAKLNPNHIFSLKLNNYETIKIEESEFIGYQEENVANEAKSVEGAKNKFKKSK